MDFWRRNAKYKKNPALGLVFIATFAIYYIANDAGLRIKNGHSDMTIGGKSICPQVR